MGDGEIAVLKLDDSGDVRGSSFPVPPDWFAEPFPVRDAHITTLLPGHTRGNHFHVDRHEILIVLFSDRWSLYWDSGDKTEVNHRRFESQGAVAMRIPPHYSHAITNEGLESLYIVGLTDGPYDPVAPDASPRKVVL